jgi:hypothetical protein
MAYDWEDWTRRNSEDADLALLKDHFVSPDQVAEFIEALETFSKIEHYEETIDNRFDYEYGSEKGTWGDKPYDVDTVTIHLAAGPFQPVLYALVQKLPKGVCTNDNILYYWLNEGDSKLFEGREFQAEVTFDGKTFEFVTMLEDDEDDAADRYWDARFDD